MRDRADVLIIGAGSAGLSAALWLAEHFDVILLAKRDLMESSTRHAQGGFSAVLASDDDFESHIEDTLSAGAGLCHEDVVEMVVRAGPKAARRLGELGVPFDHATDGSLSLGREGGHSRRRVARVKDQTGLAIQTALAERARQHPRIRILERHMAVDLVTRSRSWRNLPKEGGVREEGGEKEAPGDRCEGAYALDLDTGDIHTFAASATLIATGGAGKVYLYTSNPDVASGDGIAMAYRAGARIANMEFMQFHPTCLYHPRAKSFLVSEALRGEGGVLRTASGEPFMGRFHTQADLAPRDIVARAIDHVLKTRGDDCVYLDMTHRPAAFLEEHFPFILERCLELGIDMRTQPIPVVPAAHYSCGGVQVDGRGRSSLEGLWAIGETACSGLHGANRLASNSLLECAVFGAAAAEDIIEIRDRGRLPAPRADLPIWSPGFARPLTEGVVISESWDEIRRAMTNYVGIVRSNKRLARARRRVEALRAEIHEDYWETLLNGDLVELRNLVTVAWLVVECALARRESRGLHFNVDYPHRDDRNWRRDTVIWRGQRGQVLYQLGSL